MYKHMGYTQIYLIKRIAVFTILLCACFMNMPASIAFDLPYGVQDPIMGSAGWMNCEGHEIGFWNVVQRQNADGRKVLYLVLTTVDLVDSAYIICVVPADRKVMVMETEKLL